MMLAMRFALMAIVVAGVSDCCLPSTAWAQQAPGTINLREPSLRRAASVSPLPEYPQTSLKSKVTGVAVASVSIGRDGRIDKVEILEAPDPDIAAAVREAVERWVVPWRSGPAGEPARPRTGKLTFYFRIVDGAGRVFNPEEMPGGPRPRQAGRSVPVPASRGSSTPPAAPGTAEAPSSKTITVAEMKKLQPAARPLVLDIGSRDAFKRGHTPGAVNIPVDELPVRAGIELAGAKVAIDCTRDEMWRCQAAGAILGQQGLTQTLILVR